MVHKQLSKMTYFFYCFSPLIFSTAAIFYQWYWRKHLTRMMKRKFLKLFITEVKKYFSNLHISTPSAIRVSKLLYMGVTMLWFVIWRKSCWHETHCIIPAISSFLKFLQILNIRHHFDWDSRDYILVSNKCSPKVWAF